jgi:hypothetical protein
MRFKNRDEAATQLAGRLVAYKGQNPLILGVPRGALPMARTIADALGGEIALPRITSQRPGRVAPHTSRASQSCVRQL